MNGSIARCGSPVAENAKKFLPLLLIAVLAYSSPGKANNDLPTNWRFFKTSDGLAESWSSYITIGPSGKVLISHGVINGLSWFDGQPTIGGKYLQNMKSPGDDLKVYESRSGQLWSLYSNGVQLYKNGNWAKYKIDDIVMHYPPDNIVRTLIPFLPGERDQVFYLLPNRLMAFDASTETNGIVSKAEDENLGRFIDMIAARDGGIWVTGENGVAKLELGPGPTVKRWEEYLLTGLGVKDLQEPVEGDDQKLFAVAVNIRTNKNELVRFDGARWRILNDYTGTVLKGWPGVEDSYWILKEQHTLACLRNGKEEIQDKADILSGEIREVAVEPGGVFWLTTSHGVARYTPSIWRTPAEINEVKTRIHAIHEDSAGRLWFAAIDNILLFDNENWKIYPMPAGLETQPYFTQSIYSLPDGRIAVGTIPYNDYLLAFNPETEKFERISHYNEDSPDETSGRRIGLIAPRRDGKILVQTIPSTYANTDEPTTFRLELFDGKSFKTVMDRGNNWNFGILRYFLETRNGDLWIGGQGAAAAILSSEGEYKIIKTDERFAGNGYFVIYETEDGKIWVGGRDNILEYDGRNWSVVLSDLASVRSITSGRDGSVWVASGTGVHRYYQGSWIINTMEDGLPNTAAFSVYEDSRGRVWVGTISGLSLYHPEADVDPPETIISEIDNLKETPPGGEVRLIFSGLDKWKHTRSDRLLFCYRLDSGDWSPYRTGNVALFNKLPYGKHRFEVRAMDVNMNFDPEPASFEFTVLLPWYKETGFQIIAGIGGAVIVFLLGLAIHRHVLLEKLVVVRTNDLQGANIKLKQNVTELIRAKETLKREHSRLEVALEYKSLLAEIASRLNSASSFDDAIKEIMTTVEDRMHIDCACLFNIDPEQEYPSSPCKLLQNDDASAKPYQPCFEAPGLVEKIERDGSFIVSDTRELPTGQSDFFRKRNIGAICVFPVTIADKTIGLISYCKRKEHAWKRGESDLFKTATDIISNAWERYRHFHARLEAEKKQTAALQMADKASRLASIGVIAAGITHEINQPLNDIKVTADSVLLWDRGNKGILPGDFSQWLKSISGSVNRISGIIKQMRSYWATPNQSKDVTINLNQAVQNALSLLSRQLTSHGIDLEIVEKENDLFVTGNRINLEQIVLNLVANAMHALDSVEAKKKKIRVSIFRENNTACLEIRDNGTGLPEGAVKNLFDPFFTTKKSVDGMGLGLAIVKRFAEGFGGSVEVMNNSDGGATFIVGLPIQSKPRETASKGTV